MRQVGLRNALASRQAQVADLERRFSANLCASGEDGCAGDPRLYDWQAKGYGLVEPVLTTRWQDDGGSLLSFCSRSRLDIGGFTCEDLRAGCPGMVADDGVPGEWSYLELATSPDAGTG